MSQAASESKSSLSHPVSGDGRGNTNPTARHRSWCFTVNNWTDSDKSLIVSLVSEAPAWIYGEEVGENGTPHLQGFIKFKNQVRFSTLKSKLPRAHWIKARGSVDDNFKYCSKDGKFETNIIPKISREELKNMVAATYENVIWKPWQRDVLDLVDADNSTRTIYWVYEISGNVGKSFVAKYLALRSGTIVCQGKSSDVFNQTNAAIESGLRPELVLVDIPRTTLDYVCYNAIECLKNGMLYSGKYEGGLCLFPSPTVMCFANEMPKLEKLSRDRWMIYVIKDNILYQKLI